MLVRCLRPSVADAVYREQAVESCAVIGLAAGPIDRDVRGGAHYPGGLRRVRHGYQHFNQQENSRQDGRDRLRAVWSRRSSQSNYGHRWGDPGAVYACLPPTNWGIFGRRSIIPEHPIRGLDYKRAKRLRFGVPPHKIESDLGVRTTGLLNFTRQLWDAATAIVPIKVVETAAMAPQDARGRLAWSSMRGGPRCG